MILKTLLMWFTVYSEIENKGIITVKVQNKRIINFSWNAKEV